MVGSGRLSARSSFRLKRFSLFVDRMGLIGAAPDSVRILDMGGAMDYWRSMGEMLPPSIREILVVNLDQKTGRQS